MSVTIRYHGSLKNLKVVEELEEEFLDIARVQGWPVERVDGAYSSLKQDLSLEAEVPSTTRLGAAVATVSRPLTLKGIKLVVHPQTDPLCFTFDSSGVLTRLSYFAMDYYPQAKAAASRRFGFVHQSQASIQTSLAGFECHATVVRVLDYLKKRYVPDLSVMDDSGYWLHRDAKLLQRALIKKA